MTVIIAIVSSRAAASGRGPFERRWYRYSSEDDDGSRTASLAHHLHLGTIAAGGSLAGDRGSVVIDQ
jgi:hypothetical protein